MKDAIIQELIGSELEPFMLLLSEIECGNHFSNCNPKHVSWLKHKIKSHIAAGARFFGYRTKEGDILGVVGVLVERKLFCDATAEIVDIGVENTHRRNGLGTELLNHALLIAREEGVYAAFARTYAADTDTIAFYGRNAFCPVAVIPGANGPTDEGDIVMRRRLSNKPDAGDA